MLHLSILHISLQMAEEQGGRIFSGKGGVSRGEPRRAHPYLCLKVSEKSGWSVGQLWSCWGWPRSPGSEGWREDKENRLKALRAGLEPMTRHEFTGHVGPIWDKGQNLGDQQMSPVHTQCPTQSQRVPIPNGRICGLSSTLYTWMPSSEAE